MRLLLKRYFLLCGVLSYFLFALPLQAAAMDLPTEELVPGGIAIIQIQSASNNNAAAPVVHFQNHRVMVARFSDDYSTDWHAIVGIPRSAKAGEYSIKVKLGAEQTTQHFQVQSKHYPEQRIQITNKRLVNPEKRDINRIITESRIMKQAFTSWSESRVGNLRMDWPVSGPISSPFGLTRFFNEQPRKPHSGIDIAAPVGSPISAPKSGKVLATGDYFFNGNTVILDHGQGLISMFCHLDRIEVQSGNLLRRGERVGTVGQTGRATGPHLHWSLNLNNVRVNPMLFLNEPSNNGQQ
ncbi:MAG: peptidoglycan DD-metalloendopeptidase family protein [Pseudomonadales bacterium]|nr:peptidoglycan DD-metalloendopeptidase family protein [Pseudomonadales bacterium]